MATNSPVLTVRRVQDDFESSIDAIENFEGATAPIFARVFVAGEEGSDSRRDALALAAAIAGRGEVVTVPERADLVVTGSAADAAPGRVMLDPADRVLLEGARCPVAVAPRGLAGREDREVRRIDVGIDGGRGGSAALSTAIHLSLAREVRLRLIAVAELAFDRTGTTRGADPGELERLGRHLRHSTDGLTGVWVETELREGLADQILLGLARDADLLILGSRATYDGAGRVAIGEVAGRVLRGSPSPVLIAPAP